MTKRFDLVLHDWHSQGDQVEVEFGLVSEGVCWFARELRRRVTLAGAE